MLALIVGSSPHVRFRVEELQNHAETRHIDTAPTEASFRKLIARDRYDVLVLDGAGPDTVKLAGVAVREGIHVLVGLPRAQSIGDAKRLVPLAEEAQVHVKASSVFRMLSSIRSLRSRRPRLVSINASVGDGEEFLLRLMDWLDACLSLVESRDIQKLDAASVRSPGAGVAALGVSIRFQNGTLVLLHQDRGDGVSTIIASGDEGTDRVTLTRHAIHEETGPAVRFETRAFLRSLNDDRDDDESTREMPVSITTAVQTLQLAEHVMRRLRGRAIVTV